MFARDYEECRSGKYEKKLPDLQPADQVKKRADQVIQVSSALKR